MSTLKKYADALERVIWTAAEAAGAGGIVAAYQALPVSDIPDGWVPPVVFALTVLIAAIKNAIATNVGNGSSSTLPVTLEPIPAQATQDEMPAETSMSLQPVPEHALDADGDGQPDFSDEGR